MTQAEIDLIFEKNHQERQLSRLSFYCYGLRSYLKDLLDLGVVEQGSFEDEIVMNTVNAVEQFIAGIREKETFPNDCYFTYMIAALDNIAGYLENIEGDN